MFIAYLITFFVALFSIKPRIMGFNSDYMSIESTRSIKGLFVIFVFFRHVQQYLVLSDHFLDRLFDLFDGILGQLIVVMFLFYSGYGIIKKIKKTNGGGIFDPLYITEFCRFIPNSLFS